MNFLLTRIQEFYFHYYGLKEVNDQQNRFFFFKKKKGTQELLGDSIPACTRHSDAYSTIHLKSIVKSMELFTTLATKLEITITYITHNTRLCPQSSFVLPFILFILYSIFIEMELIS